MKKSFTLIEILITSTIILLFGGLSLVFVVNFNQKKILENEAQKIVNALETAKKKAYSSEVGNCQSLCGYLFTINNNSYSIKRCCNCNHQDSCTNSFLIQSYSFSNFAIKSLDNYSTMFKPLNPIVTPGQIRLINQLTNQCQLIKINQIGAIESEKINCP